MKIIKILIGGVLLLVSIACGNKTYYSYMEQHDKTYENADTINKVLNAHGLDSFNLDYEAVSLKIPLTSDGYCNMTINISNGFWQTFGYTIFENPKEIPKKYKNRFNFVCY